MAIQPIDLQNMYSQLSNVSKVIANQPEVAQLNNSVKQENQIQQNLENTQKVNETNQDGQNTNLINADGKNGGNSFYQNPNKSQQENKDESEQKLFSGNSSSLVGRIVDITR